MTFPSQEVKPLTCPFCGDWPRVFQPYQDETHYAGHNVVWHAVVKCSNCDVQMCAEDPDREAAIREAIEFWNRRELESRVSPVVATAPTSDAMLDIRELAYNAIREIDGMHDLGKTDIPTIRDNVRAILAITSRPSSAPEEATDRAALKELFDFIDIVHPPNPESQPRFFELFEAVRPQVYPFARAASRSSGEDQPSSMLDFAKLCVRSGYAKAHDDIKRGTGPSDLDKEAAECLSFSRSVNRVLGSGEDQTAAATDWWYAKGLHEQIDALKQQVIDSALRAERLETDAERWKYCLENAAWHRSDEGEQFDYMAIPVAKGADLSCIAFRRDAIDAAMRGASLSSQPAPQENCGDLGKGLSWCSGLGQSHRCMLSAGHSGAHVCEVCTITWPQPAEPTGAKNEQKVLEGPGWFNHEAAAPQEWKSDERVIEYRRRLKARLTATLAEGGFTASFTKWEEFLDCLQHAAVVADRVASHPAEPEKPATAPGQCQKCGHVDPLLAERES